VLIAADRPLLRAGIGRLLAGSGAAADAGYAGSLFEPRIEIVGEAATADAAVAACRELRPDVVLADLGLTAAGAAATAGGAVTVRPPSRATSPASGPSSGCGTGCRSPSTPTSTASSVQATPLHHPSGEQRLSASDTTP
jgi:hypothetical protein